MLRHFPASSLFVSQPPPSHFGNGPNTPDAPGWTSRHWLTSRFHFNFAEYSGGRSSFGCLRVMNDDLVQPQRGFGEHPHREMEILTYIVRGNLTHRDSMGTAETLTRHAVQFMSAGTGVHHSEFNNHPREDLRFVQIWITPAATARGSKPAYGSYSPPDQLQPQTVYTLAGPAAKFASPHTLTTAPIHIQQDASLSVALVEPSKTLSLFTLAPKRQAYVLVVEGSGVVGGTRVAEGDGLEVTGGDAAVVAEAGVGGMHVLWVEMAK